MSEAGTTIADIRPGAQVNGVFACTRKDLLVAKTGTQYLVLELRDRTGSIEAKAFKDAAAMANAFERGDAVAVTARAQDFRGRTQLEVESARRAQSGSFDHLALLPRAYRDMEELDGFLEHLAREVYDPSLRAVLDELVGDDELREKWRTAPCSRAGHHPYLGGLLEHTVAVATLAVEIAQLHPRLDSDLLLTAAIVHDIGKTREFTYGADISLSDEGRLLGHVNIGITMLDRRMEGSAVTREARLRLLHCVATHHGVEGRRFQSPEALALCRLNGVDAQVKAALGG